MAPHLAELVVDAGGLENLVGVVSYSDFPESIKNIQKIGDAFKVDFETIVSLQPDYVLTWKDGTPNSIINKLKQLNIEVIETDISSIKDIPTTIHQISKLINTQAIAAKEIEQFNQKLNSISHQSHPKLSAFIQVSIKPIYTISATHWMSEAIALCGYENVFYDLKQISAPISLESIIAKNPEAIININQVNDDKWKQWPDLKAVKNNKIYTFSADIFSRPSPRLLDGIQQLCATN
jgi:iron complex transport system substrate-binding protein